MRVLIYTPGQAARELTETEVTALYVISHRVMGLPQLLAPQGHVEVLLGSPDVDPLAQAAAYAAYGVANALDYELAANPEATGHLERLLGRALPAPLHGPILVIDAQAMAGYPSAAGAGT